MEENVFSRVFKGTSFLMLGSLTSLGLTALSDVLIARFLSPREYGVFAISTALAFIFATVFDLGFSWSPVKYIPEFLVKGDKKALKQLVTFCGSFKLLLTLFSSFLIFMLSGFFSSFVFHNKALQTPLAASAFVVLGFSLLGFVWALFQGFQRMEYIALTNVLRGVLRLILPILFIVTGLGVIGAILGVGVSFIVPAMALAFMAFRLVPNDGLRGGFIDKGEVFKFGLFLWVASLFSSLNNQFPPFLLGIFKGGEEVGFLRAALNIPMAVARVTAPLAMALFPAFSEISVLYAKREVDKLFRESARFSSWFFGFVACVLSLLAWSITVTLYSRRYEPASQALAILGFTALLFGLRSVEDPLFNGLGRGDLTLKVNLYSLTSCTILLLTLSPLMGFLGASIAVLVSLTIGVLIGLLYIKRDLKVEFSPLKDVFLPLTPSLATLTVLSPFYSLRIAPMLHILLCLTASIVLFAFFTPLFGGLTLEEVKRLKEMSFRFLVTRPISFFFSFLEVFYRLKKP